MAKLIVFDFDGTILAGKQLCTELYSVSLERVIYDQRSTHGIEVLEKCRKNYAGKGELALNALNIPFRNWAHEIFITALKMRVDLHPYLCQLIRRLKAQKVIYSGSPIEVIMRFLPQLGFTSSDFQQILGWQEPEQFPLKWACSPLVFKGILKEFSIAPADALAVGDVWDTDLLPAKTIGMKTAIIGEKVGHPDFCFSTLERFLEAEISSQGE